MRIISVIMLVGLMANIWGCVASRKTTPERRFLAEQIKDEDALPAETDAQIEGEVVLPAETYALIEVSHGGEKLGEIKLKLYQEKAPVTVENFITLAEGTKEFKDTVTGEMVKKPFYDGVVFHRVIKGFMIQGGDPLGTGRGGPGYTFKCEIVPELKFDAPGKLAMANSGPNTNGSQFFITVAATPGLNGRHTIFGEVVDGYEIVEKISLLPKDAADRPLKPVVMEKVVITRIKRGGQK